MQKVSVDWQAAGGIESLTQTTSSRFPGPSHKFIVVYLFEKIQLYTYSYILNLLFFLLSKTLTQTGSFLYTIFAGHRVFCPLVHLVVTVLVHTVASLLFLTATSYGKDALFILTR